MTDLPSAKRKLACRNCGDPATQAVRSGLEWHPVCDECAGWWAPHRLGPLSEVDPEYEEA